MPTGVTNGVWLGVWALGFQAHSAHYIRVLAGPGFHPRHMLMALHSVKKELEQVSRLCRAASPDSEWSFPYTYVQCDSRSMSV
mmetsp:Transcript_126709/g.219525  ORF Transcript_126709/g.219525 Transcript_126709/m.219525 type:complete len:83 (-) Transcript_126709:193-441(-)